MKVVSKAWHTDLVKDAKILEAQSFGVKVWLLPDNRIVKMFRLKKPLTSGRLYPYNLRFARNARRLRARGVDAPEILDAYYCPEIERHAVVYALLEGRTMRSLLQTGEKKWFELFAKFLVELHEKGIYFRSVHPNNVLVRPQGNMGLIDIQDIRFWPFALPKAVRARNFRHMYNSDKNSIEMRAFGFERFVDLYLDQLPHGSAYKTAIKPLIMRYDRAWERKHQAYN